MLYFICSHGGDIRGLYFDSSSRMINCLTPYCKNLIKKGRNKCSTCYNRAYYKRNPEKRTYQALKDNSKRRGKPFDLTFEEFKEFATETDYMANKGIFKKSLHIDRIIETLGYTRGNIQALPNDENIKKYLDFRYGESGREFTVVTQKSRPEDEKDLPF